MEECRQQRRGDGKEYGIANDANVADLHVGQRNTQEADEGEHGTDDQEYASRARKTWTPYCGRRAQSTEWKEDVPRQYVEGVGE